MVAFPLNNRGFTDRTPSALFRTLFHFTGCLLLPVKYLCSLMFRTKDFSLFGHITVCMFKTPLSISMLRKMFFFPDHPFRSIFRYRLSRNPAFSFLLTDRLRCYTVCTDLLSGYESFYTFRTDTLCLLPLPELLPVQNSLFRQSVQYRFFKGFPVLPLTVNKLCLLTVRTEIFLPFGYIMICTLNAVITITAFRYPSAFFRYTFGYALSGSFIGNDTLTKNRHRCFFFSCRSMSCAFLSGNDLFSNPLLHGTGFGSAGSFNDHPLLSCTGSPGLLFTLTFTVYDLRSLIFTAKSRLTL